MKSPVTTLFSILIVTLVLSENCYCFSDYPNEPVKSSNDNVYLAAAAAASSNSTADVEERDYVYGNGQQSDNEMADYYPNANSADLDSSVYGNTDESFFAFAERRISELRSFHKSMLDKSIATCPYAPAVTSSSSKTASDNQRHHHHHQGPSKMQRPDANNNNNAGEESNSCIVNSLSLDRDFGQTSGRLFYYDPFHIGLISSSDSTLRIFNFNLVTRSLTLSRTKHFRNEVPFDACVDKSKNIFIVFPDQNKIGKYHLNQTFITLRSTSFGGKQNKSQIVIKELISIRESDFNPSSVACHDDYIYVSERPKNQIRIYDKILRLVRIIYLNGIVVSAHNALAVNENVRVFLDGSSGIGLFNSPQSSHAKLNSNHHQNGAAAGHSGNHHHQQAQQSVTNRRKFSLIPESNQVNVCHFYESMECLEDVELVSEGKSKSLIYAADSCNNEILQFHYSANDRIQFNSKIEMPGSPISITHNPFGYLFVLANSPRKIYILDAKQCSVPTFSSTLSSSTSSHIFKK